MAVREQVSGPGRNSKRTDMNVSKQPTRYISGGNYGEGQALLAQQQAAPMAGKRPPINLRSMGPVTSLMAPTELPTQPLTTGVDVGQGAGSEILNLPMGSRVGFSQALREAARFDETGEVSAIMLAYEQSPFNG